MGMEQHFLVLVYIVFDHCLKLYRLYKFFELVLNYLDYYWAHNLSGKQVLHKLILYFYFRI